MEKITLSSYKETLKTRSASQPKQIKTYPQELARQVCQYLNDYSEFGLWVKKAQELGAGEFKARFDYMVGRKIKNERYLLAMCRK